MHDNRENAQAALDFVRNAELPRPPRKRRGGSEQPATVFDGVKSQAMVVGSDIVSFASGVPSDVRQDIVNCSLLAQLVAKKRVSDGDRIREWYEVFFDCLTQLGWLLQEKGFAEHTETREDFEAHQAILGVATVLFGPGATALALITSTLDAMKSMANGSWITIFNRESQIAKAARFQLTVAEPVADGGAMISLMAFELEAKATLTQVLFFKFRSSDVTLRHASGKVTINSEVLATVRPAIAAKIAAFTKSYVEALQI